MKTQAKTTFRSATIADCPMIARLMQIASDGVCDYIWTAQKSEFPELMPLEIGAQRYATADGNFSYRSCTLATTATPASTNAKTRIQGLMMAFAIPPLESAVAAANSDEAPSELDRVLAPYLLEQPNSWYICALAVFPDYRGQGIGTQFLSLAAEQARSQGLPALSLLCFEQNTGALRLYQRHGFRVVQRTAVVPHPLIRHTGDLLLMTKPV